MKKIFAKICWQLKTRLGLESARAALCKWATCTRQSCQKLLQNRSTCKNNTKKYWENGNDASIRVQTTINISIFTFLCFYDNINVKENVFFQSASWKKHCATHWREQCGWDQVIFDWFVLSMRMQVILDSSFARPGSAPIWGGKKGEFRDWTRLTLTKGTGQNNYTRTGPSKPQNSWWCLPASPMLNVKRWCLCCIPIPLTSSRKLQWDSNLTFSVCHLILTLC